MQCWVKLILLISFEFSEETHRVLRLSLDEFSLPKFYLLFGISKVKSAAVTAFRSSYRHAGDRWLGHYSPMDRERLALTSLEVITDALLEIVEACMRDIPECDWLQCWTSLSKSFAFRYNPALQPRALIVFGCISKSIQDTDIKQLLRILVKALESFSDVVLIEAIVMCLTRLIPLLRPESAIHRMMFWVAISVLQLDEVSLYASGLALLEQNLHTLDSQAMFESKSLEQIMTSTREPLEWHFKQLDHAVGLSFKSSVFTISKIIFQKYVVLIFRIIYVHVFCVLSKFSFRTSGSSSKRFPTSDAHHSLSN